MTGPLPGTALILADKRDAHARVVATRLWEEHRVNCIIWSFEQFPRNERLSFVTEGSRIRADGPALAGSIEEILSIWWRRPGHVNASSAIMEERVRGFVNRESNEFLLGVLESLGAPIINNPRHQSFACRKPLQLTSAISVGLKIPRTLLSNDPERIRDFWSELNGRCIYKAFSSPPWTALETRRMTRSDLDALHNAALCPMIVQEEIERLCDIRVNIIGTELFAAKVSPKHPIATVDSRFDVTAVWEAMSLPNEVTDKLYTLMRVLKLDYGCIDMRQQPDGEFVFLEINPAGQFLFIEIDTGQPLSAAMARLLVQGSRFPG